MDTPLVNDGHILGWPRQLSKLQSAAYVGLSVGAFERLVQAGTFPCGIDIEGVLLWDRRTLDVAVDEMHGRCAPAHTASPSFPAGNGFGRTLGELICAYQSGEKFQSLAPRTQSDYSKVFEHLKAIESTPLDQITPGFLTRFKDELKVGQRAKVYVIQVLGAVFTWGRQRDWLTTNPAHGVEIKRRIGHGNRPWKPFELDAVLTAASPRLRLAVLLGAYTGLREGDVLRLTWSAYDGAAIKTKQGKTGREVVIPVHTRLKQELAAAPKVHPVIVVGKRGVPFTEDGFRGSFFRLIRQLTKHGKVEKGLTFHGLRHTLGTALAESGASTRTIATVLGHANQRMSEYYSRHAETARQAEAAIRALG